MFAIERQKFILKHLQKYGQITTAQICKHLDISATTARNDLNALEKKKLILRAHGGATLLNGNARQTENIPANSDDDRCYNFKSRENKCVAEKRQIAQKALSFISARGSVYLDSGTTSLFIAKAISASKKKLIVITHGIHIMMELIHNPNITVIFVGGIVGKDAACVEGTLGAGIFERLNIDIAFLSGYGISLDYGLTEFNPYEAELKQLIIKHSQKIIAVVDSSKFGILSTSYFCSIDDVDTVITDANVSQKIIDKCKKDHINLIY